MTLWKSRVYVFDSTRGVGTFEYVIDNGIDPQDPVSPGQPRRELAYC